MKVDVSALKIPDGWVADTNVWPGASIVALEAPASVGGFVTIDFERRVFAGGYARPSQLSLPSKKTYSGRGWQQAIVDDAIGWLQVDNRLAGAFLTAENGESPLCLSTPLG